MFEKYITFVLIPKKNSEMKKLRIPLHWFLLAILTILTVISIWTYVLFDYFAIRESLADLEEHQETYVTLDHQIREFEGQKEEMSLHYEHLNWLADKLKRITSSQETNEVNKRLLTAEEKKAHKQKIVQAKEKGILSVIVKSSDSLDLDESERTANTKTLQNFITSKGNMLNQIPAGWPLQGIVIERFGLSVDTFTGHERPNHAITIASRNFAPVKATADGFVTFAGSDEIYGNLVILEHGNGIVTKYGYISAPKAKKGELVKKGDVLAEVVNTGLTAGSQLHYEVLFNKIPQDPLYYIHLKDSLKQQGNLK